MCLGLWWLLVFCKCVAYKDGLAGNGRALLISPFLESEIHLTFLPPKALLDRRRHHSHCRDSELGTDAAESKSDGQLVPWQAGLVLGARGEDSR